MTAAGAYSAHAGHRGRKGSQEEEEEVVLSAAPQFYSNGHRCLRLPTQKKRLFSVKKNEKSKQGLNFRIFFCLTYFLNQILISFGIFLWAF
jgi:hypothetical protein